MNTRLASLDATLEQLALEFARKLTAAAMTAPVAELRAFLGEGSALSRILLDGIAKLAPPEVARVFREVAPPEPDAAPAKRAAAPEPLEASPARPPVVRAALPAPRRARPVVTRPRARPRPGPDPVDDGEAFANAITDPSILLERIGTGPAVTARELRREVELLSPPVRVTEAGPALRPGERLQRTSGGNMVLRRGGK